MKAKVAIFGGTFNPVHYGHLKIAKVALQNLKLKKVLFTPNFIPVDKKEKIAKEHRIAMLKLALTNILWAKLDFSEYSRQDKSFTIDTINHFLKTNLNTDLHLLIGEDCLANFTTWKDWQEILHKVKIVVFPRAGVGAVDEKLLQQVIYLPMAKLNISSTNIRHKIKNHEQVTDLLPRTVLSYITQKRLYS